MTRRTGTLTALVAACVAAALGVLGGTHAASSGPGDLHGTGDAIVVAAPAVTDDVANVRSRVERSAEQLAGRTLDKGKWQLLVAVLAAAAAAATGTRRLGLAWARMGRPALAARQGESTPRAPPLDRLANA